MFLLQRNLKDMVIMGLSSKKEKEDRLEKMKKDVAEQIRMQVPYMKAKVRLSHPGVCVGLLTCPPNMLCTPCFENLHVGVISVCVHGIHLLPLSSPTTKIRKRATKEL